MSNLKLSARTIHWLRNSFATFFFLYVLMVTTHEYWLPFFGEFLIVKSPLVKSDLIVVSTGSYYRFLYAIDLIKKGYAANLLLLGDERFRNISGEKTPLQMARVEALEEGVPIDNLITSDSTSTQDDAIVAQKLMLAKGFKSAIVISDRYNMKRVSMVFNRVFHNSKIELIYAFSENEDGLVAPNRWWKSPSTFIYVIKEWVKIPLNFFMFERRLQ